MTRRGYILVFVLGVTTVVTALGLSYISANGTVMTQATNRYAATRAQYVAESGIGLAEHYLRYPPTTVPANAFFSGVTGLAIDETNDTVDIAVTAASSPDHYNITSSSTVRDALGTTQLAKKSITARVIIPPLPKWKIAQAVLANAAVNVPSGITIAGNLHSNVLVNGPLLGGTCNGVVSAVGTAVWLAGGPPSAVQSLRPAVTCPPTTATLYQTYNILGQSYVAYSGFTQSSLTSGAATSLTTTLNAATNNPGRIVILPTGDVTLSANVNFTGCLVIQGNLTITGVTNTLTAVADYPALVVTGDIRSGAAPATLTVTGPVVCGGKITDNGRINSNLQFNGAVIAHGGIERTGSGSTLQFTWSSAGSTFWDFARSAQADPFTRLTWQEN